MREKWRDEEGAEWMREGGVDERGMRGWRDGETEDRDGSPLPAAGLYPTAISGSSVSRIKGLNVTADIAVLYLELSMALNTKTI